MSFKTFRMSTCTDYNPIQRVENKLHAKKRAFPLIFQYNYSIHDLK